MILLLKLIKFLMMAIFAIFILYAFFNVIVDGFGFILAAFAWLATDKVAPLLWEGPLAILVWGLGFCLVFLCLQLRLSQ